MPAISHQPLALKDVPSDWQDQFGQLGGHARKVICLTCGATGYHGEPNEPMPWQLGCLAGHPETCEYCGARFQVGGLGKHQGLSRGRCGDAPIGGHKRLLEFLVKTGAPLPD